MIDRVLDHIQQLTCELKDIPITDLPGVAVTDWRPLTDLPVRTSAIYFLVSRSQGLLYIGRATNLRSRWDNLPVDLMNDFPAHAKRRPAIELGDVTLHWWGMPRECLAIVESILLQVNKPPWNTARG